MSAQSPSEAEYVLPVEHILFRRFAGFIRENQLLAALIIAAFGAVFSLVSLVFPFAVIPDIGIDIITGVLSVTYMERRVTERASVTAGVSTSAESTVVESDER